MGERLRSSLSSAGEKAEYDAYAKQILAVKIVLAHILTGVVPEYYGMEPEQVVPLIENEPEISEVPVLPGETKQAGMSAITGMNTEDRIPNEGTITYDIRFYAWHPDRKRKHKIIVDLEAQKQKPGQYDIVTRGIFYNARQLSAQLDTEFEIPYYNDIKKVYSIWICLNSPEYLANTTVLYDVQAHDLVGTVKKKGRYDLHAVIEVHIAKELAKGSEELRLHRLLGTLLSPHLRLKEKTDILSQEYGIETTDRLRKGMQQMCNLSEAIEEEGIRKGRLEEQVNTERERRRAEAAEAENAKLKKELEQLKKGLKRFM